MNIQKHKVLDLFSGIGGFSLGLERTGGFETVAFCEIDKYCQKVLKKHWADVPMYDDIKELTNERLESEGIFPTVITAGFPCQDISLASGKGEGIHGERSGLFFDIVRLVRQIRPAYCILENVSALLGRGLGEVLGEFSEIGYDCEWHCISASSIGANHKRSRVWIVAYPNGNEHREKKCKTQLNRSKNAKRESRKDLDVITCRNSENVPRARPEPKKAIVRSRTLELFKNSFKDFWLTEPCVRTLDDGIPYRLVRLKVIGNSLVPQIPEMIGNAILEYERENQ